ncbi:MAG: ABC-type transport auxiliary lipoprotein family protein [Planctomycetota bacterium]|nr:ABC-type transport auxiliary lipoprotein family protein [Planctomycetota bacterium]
MNRFNLRAGRVACLVACLCALAAPFAGCAAPPDERFYDLNVKVPPAKAAIPLTLAVKGFAASGECASERMAYRKGDVEIAFYRYQRWTRPPAEMVRDAFVTGLRGSSSFQNVWELGHPGDADWVLGGRLRRFEEVDSANTWEARLSLDLFVTDARSGKLVYSRAFERSAPAERRNPEAVAAAMSKLLGEVVEAVRGDLAKQLAATKP